MSDLISTIRHSIGHKNRGDRCPAVSGLVVLVCRQCRTPVVHRSNEVAALNPDLVVRDAKAELSTVRYEAINMMLLNEFKKEHKKVEKLEATVADLEAQLHKVSAQVQLNNSAARFAANNQ